MSRQQRVVAQSSTTSAAFDYSHADFIQDRPFSRRAWNTAATAMTAPLAPVGRAGVQISVHTSSEQVVRTFEASQASQSHSTSFTSEQLVSAFAASSTLAAGQQQQPDTVAPQPPVMTKPAPAPAAPALYPLPWCLSALLLAFLLFSWLLYLQGGAHSILSGWAALFNLPLSSAGIAHLDQLYCVACGADVVI